MSRDQALAFLKHASENAELQEKIVAFAAREGYEFTVEELSDAELDAAAGGAIYMKIPDIKGESFRLGTTAFKFLKIEGP